ncbi:DUF6870 family protein [Oscillospiraceae bacterium 44-5]|nr:hypothetical protein [Lawsonibacter sp.]MDE7055582.1 hypothetical protein [Oscillospiraceae bacterium]
MDYKEQAEKQLHSEDFDKYALPDISEVKIPDADSERRIFAFLQAVRNPYLFRVGDIGVHVTFSGKNGDTLQKRVCNLLSKSI